MVYLYNGPHVQLIKNGFPESGNLWYEYLAQHGYIVWTMDGRGSSNREHAGDPLQSWSTPDICRRGPGGVRNTPPGSEPSPHRCCRERAQTMRGGWPMQCNSLQQGLVKEMNAPDSLRLEAWWGLRCTEPGLEVGLF